MQLEVAKPYIACPLLLACKAQMATSAVEQPWRALADDIETDEPVSKVAKVEIECELCHRKPQDVRGKGKKLGKDSFSIM